MAITKQKKVTILDKLTKQVVSSPTIVFVSFKGIPVMEITAFRRGLRIGGSDYYVAKKTLIRKAFADSQVAGDMPELAGEIAVTYLTATDGDLIAPAKGVYEFTKTHPDQMKIVGGVFEGKFISALEMTALAAIPSREVLYGRLVNVINSPIQGLVLALDAISKKSAN